MYRTDHIKVLRVLAGGLPKRTTFRTKDIVMKAFKRCASGDRRVRNAYRKLVKEGHVETVDRGVYRLTASGAALCKKLERSRWKVPKELSVATTKTGKKVSKKVNKKTAKKRVRASSSVVMQEVPISREMSVGDVLSF